MVATPFIARKIDDQYDPQHLFESQFYGHYFLAKREIAFNIQESSIEYEAPV